MYKKHGKRGTPAGTERYAPYQLYRKI